MKYIKSYEKIHLKIGDYVKIYDDYNLLPIVKIIDGKNAKNQNRADHYAEAFLHNMYNPEMNIESKWIELWISNDIIERKATEEEFNEQKEMIERIKNIKKYNL